MMRSPARRRHNDLRSSESAARQGHRDPPRPWETSGELLLHNETCNAESRILPVPFDGKMRSERNLKIAALGWLQGLFVRRDDPLGIAQNDLIEGITEL